MATRYSQPQSGARIDWANPITRGLKIAVNSAGYNFAQTRVVTEKGIAFSWARGAPNPIDTLVSNAAVSSHSCLVFARHPSLSGFAAETYLSNTVTSNIGFSFDAAAAVGVFPTQTFKLRVTHGGVASYPSTVDISGGNTSVLPIAFTSTVSGSVRYFAGGQFLDSVVTGTINQSSSTLRIGAVPFWASGYANYDLPALFYWNRALSDAEIKQLSDNPWSIFQPVNRAIWVPVSAGSTGYTLTADQASYTLSGADATLTYTGSRTLTADSGAYSLTGNAATLAFNRNLAATQATYTLTGDAANLAFNRVLGADTVGYSLTGNTATLAFNRVLGADTVGYSLTGSAATLDYTPITGATYTLPAASTDFALTPSDAALIAARKVVADAYAAVLAGADATLTYTPAALPTIGRPASDTSNSGWTASTGIDLFAMVDEVTPDPLDYIVTTATGSVCELALEQTAYPGTASQALKYRASSSTGNSLIVRLKNGATTIRTETQALTATDTEYVITLTSGEIAAITSGSLSVELESA